MTNEPIGPKRAGASDAATKITVALVEDHPLFRVGLRHIIEANGQFEVVAEADNGLTGMEIIRSHQPQLAVLDINLPKMNGLDLISALRAIRSETRLVVLTMYDDEETFNRVMSLDVIGYLLKENAVTEIVRCLNSAVAGDPYVTPSLSKYLLQRRRRAEALTSRESGLEALTTAEARILKLISQGQSNKEIAGLLFISPRTVEAHRSHIRAKLGLKGDHGLLRFAIENQHAISQITAE
jgi:DNA-binding NarL/FixJ family response regulator